MNRVTGVLTGLLAALRPAFFWAAVLLAALALLDWLVRTRRISPFSPISRFTRETLDPLFRPVERAVTRAGGNPANAPWWSLVLVVVAGLVVLSLLDFVRAELAYASFAAAGGAGGLGAVVLRWAFQLMRLALLVRVVSSWFRVSAFSRWVRWAFALSEPLLAPLRRVLPTLGMIDISPIVAYLLLGLLETVVLGALR